MIAVSGRSCASPKRISQARRAGSVDGKTSNRTGYHPVVSSHSTTRSPSNIGRHVPPSRRNGNSGAARAKDSSTRSVACPSTSSRPTTVTPSVDPKVASGTIRSAGNGAAAE